MANDYGANKWTLDTVHATALFTPTQRIRVKMMQWVPNALNDDLLVEDGYGNDIWSITNAAGGGEANKITFPTRDLDLFGFRLTTMTGGVLHVWLG